MDGARAEQRALLFLEARGLKLLVRNWRCRAGELDLVMRDGDTIVITEVRSRTRAEYGSAAETVDRRKQERMIRATRALLAQRPELAERPLRFDVVALDDAGAMEWIQSAFDVQE